MPEVIYRKYRPRSFSEVVGQRHVVAVLEKALLKNRIAHAYLFSGPRGTGKTTVARIFARAVNCANLEAQLPRKEVELPCNRCEICSEFLSGKTLDLAEMDAASSRGIDEVRSLREAVQVLPFKAKYKVYIMDEVHMLTNEAFNALLKTLEEPPSHVIFILATTELEKIPDTIVSRSQHFEFRLIAEEEIQSALAAIAKQEGLEIDPEALGIIAALAEGSLRDAQSTMEQAISYGEKLGAGEVREILGIPEREILEKLLAAILSKDAKSAVKIIHKNAEANADMKGFSKLLIRSLRFALYLKLDGNYEKEFARFLSGPELKFLKETADKFPLPDLENALKELYKSYQFIKLSYLQELPLELAVLKIASG